MVMVNTRVVFKLVGGKHSNIKWLELDADPKFRESKPDISAKVEQEGWVVVAHVSVRVAGAMFEKEDHGPEGVKKVSIGAKVRVQVLAQFAVCMEAAVEELVELWLTVLEGSTGIPFCPGKELDSVVMVLVALRSETVGLVALVMPYAKTGAVGRSSSRHQGPQPVP